MVYAVSMYGVCCIHVWCIYHTLYLESHGLIEAGCCGGVDHDKVTDYKLMGGSGRETKGKACRRRRRRRRRRRGRRRRGRGGGRREEGEERVNGGDSVAVVVCSCVGVCVQYYC
jgi:hypothetical protein